MPSEIVFSTFGGPDALEWSSEAEFPEALPSQVVIVVAAAPVNNVDAKILSGSLAGIVTTLLPSGIGREAAGVVIARGSAVRDVEVGDEVLGFADTGAYAQFAALSTYVRKPAALSWAVAASLPLASATANRILDQLELTAGQTLVIAGGGGAVGSMATQLAMIRGLRVIATAGVADLAYLTSLGATAVRYGHGFARRVRAAAPAGIDGALDTSGARVLSELVQLTGAASQVITISDASAEVFGVRFSAGDTTERSRSRLKGVADLAASGALSVRISRTYPMSQAAQAHRDLARGSLRGRIVLTSGA